MKATKVIRKHIGSNKYIVTATVNDLSYQKRFDCEPSIDEVDAAIKSFEDNYAGLNASNNKPIKTSIHHSEQ